MMLHRGTPASGSVRSNTKRSTPPLRTTTPTRSHQGGSAGTASRQQQQAQRHGLHMLDVSRLHHVTTPAANQHRRATDASATTPGSARSTTSTSRSAESMAELEHTIVEVLGVRMQSLVDLRQRVDQLSELYRREEDTFRTQMHHVLERSEVVRVSNETREEALEAALAKERADRNRVLELMAQFKKEGAVVIQVMKDSLREATAKWKSELERNAKLTAQLRKYADVNGGGIGSNGAPAGDAAVRSGSAAAFTAAFEATTMQQQQQQQRVDALTQLVQEEDEMIVALQHRNRLLEQRVVVLTQQRDKLLEVDAEQCVVTDAFQKEYQTVQQTIRHCDSALHALQKNNSNSSSNSGPAALVGHPQQQKQQHLLYAQKCEALDRFVKLLMQRLAIEQRQRLKVEEQSARIASAQDQLVQSLEARIKELDRGGGGGGGGTPKQPATHHHSRHHSAESSVQRQRGVNHHGVVGVDFVSPALGPADSPHDPLDEFEPQQRRRPDHDHEAGLWGSRRGDIDVETVPPQPTQLGAEGGAAIRGSRSGEDSEAEAERLLPIATSAAGVKRSTDNGSRFPSLEEQLALVTQEFHASVDEWNEQQQHIVDPVVSQHRRLMQRSRGSSEAADDGDDVDANDL